ncbi:MAG TPA: hypothetical protein VGG06_35080 [Thermoanaerobaculia bacterium]|jgi:hypothetical protein
MASGADLPTRLRFGTLLATIAGAFPFTVGTIMFVAVQISALNPDKNWLAAQLPPGPTNPPFTYDQLAEWNADLAVKLHVGEHIQYVNVMNAGLAVMVLSFFGVRARLKWAWYSALAIASWIGLNDSITTLLAKQLPIPLIPTLLVFIGLFTARPEIFKKP